MHDAKCSASWLALGERFWRIADNDGDLDDRPALRSRYGMCDLRRVRHAVLPDANAFERAPTKAPEPIVCVGKPQTGQRSLKKARRTQKHPSARGNFRTREKAIAKDHVRPGFDR